MPEQRNSPADRIALTSVLPDPDVKTAFDRWVIPEQLTLWWPPVAEVEPGPGGSYHFSWPAQGWHLRGRFTDFEPGARLAYTWRWDHDPGDAETIVSIRFDALPAGGIFLTLTHGPYPDTEAGRSRRQEHLDGWMYFLGRLESLS
jgi:uncharacterized protein YndB with AHSA1/START domain